MRPGLFTNTKSPTLIVMPKWKNNQKKVRSTQGRNCGHNVTMRRAWATIVAVEKQ